MTSPSAVLQQIKSGTTDPVYLLFGEDDVEKAALADDFEELVEDGLRAFNCGKWPATRFSGRIRASPSGRNSNRSPRRTRSIRRRSSARTATPSSA